MSSVCVDRDELWERVYDASLAAYTSIPDYEARDAALTADAAAKGWYSGGGLFGGKHRRKSLRGLAKLPDPGDMLDLGCFLELEWCTCAGKLEGVRITGEKVPLLWSDRLQALFVFPDSKRGACSYPARPREAKLRQVWTRGGQTAKCAQKVKFPRPAMPIVYPGIQVSYRSNKFGSTTNYIHHHEAGVRVYFSDPPTKRRPRAIMIRGGKLSLTPHGIHG
jgi:hypothetical protein